MKRLTVMLLCISLVFLTACQGDGKENTEIKLQVQSSQPSQTIDDSQTDANLIQETLISYLDDCWGYKKDIHKFVFDEIIKLQDIEYYAFKVYLPEDEYSRSFAISLEEKKVCLLNEKGEWIEDINPEPWSKW